MKRMLSVLALAALTLPAAAQGVYRCGNTYSQQPCPDGSEIKAAPAPSANEQSRAAQAARQDAKTADAMEKARLKEEAKPVSVYIPPDKTEVAAEPDKPVISKPKKPQYFTAAAPSDKSAKKKSKKKDEPKK